MIRRGFFRPQSGKARRIARFTLPLRQTEVRGRGICYSPERRNVPFLPHPMPAHVRDLDALRDFRAALIRFSEEVVGALQSMQMELQRGFEWIEHDRPAYWTAQTRRAFDRLAAARTALTVCRTRTVAGNKPACIEEKIAVEQAQARLRLCQEKVPEVKRWIVRLHHDADEFRGRMAGLRRLLDFELPQALAQLDRQIAALEAYAELPPPEAP